MREGTRLGQCSGTTPEPRGEVNCAGVGRSLVTERTVVPGMNVRDSSLRAAPALAVCAAVLLVAGCGGGGKGGAKVLGGSNNTSVCQSTKGFGRGGGFVE